jgi:hypothetical protein
MQFSPDCVLVFWLWPVAGRKQFTLIKQPEFHQILLGDGFARVNAH